MDFIRHQLLKFELDPILVDYLSIIIIFLLIAIFFILANLIKRKMVFRIIIKL